MPRVRIDLIAGKPAAYRQAVANVVYDALLSTRNTALPFTLLFWRLKGERAGLHRPLPESGRISVPNTGNA
ncbi:hypothetical protein [Bordetella avium]|uniref:hypothetical protein n=1 Tax=Bordetella avium TaxID=521 RepID=UPI00057AAC23|nr:hypothetical protein [Bordetella avium]AZY48493.1 hypothetical protein C0J09_04645 [Bordetella avium]AZY51872.1 hypothetical protein C0J07_04700 [Bordetella avium]RIQ13801.1 hypothetical protein D0432_05860 [Bordetella avium]RIQ17127.1 hypothetical protein D0850_12665 [Bordetella avium]RIQ36147.1 hypothetical protein D0849_00255 [Bordetella avium]